MLWLKNLFNRSRVRQLATRTARWTWLELVSLAVAFVMIVSPMMLIAFNAVFPPVAQGQVTDFTISKTASATNIAPGQSVIFTITIGATSDLAFSSLTDVIPAPLVIIGFTNCIPESNCGGFLSGPSVSGNTVTYFGGSNLLSVPAQRSVTITAQAPAGTPPPYSVSNSATIANTIGNNVTSNAVIVNVVGVPPTTTAVPPTTTVVPPTTTAIPPTTTAIPPTTTAVPPTTTAVPPTTTVPPTRTNTPVGATNTPTRTNTPGGPTNTPGGTATSTSIPSTATPTGSPGAVPTRSGPRLPTATPGGIPPGATVILPVTPTPVPPTATATPTPGSFTTNPPAGTGVISGRYSGGGGTFSGKRVDLVLRAGGNETSVGNGVVDNSGQFSFFGVRTTGSSEIYFVRYSNPEGGNTLRSWTSSSFTFGGGTFTLPTADLTDVNIGAPGNSDTAFQLPLTLNWASRVSGDGYALVVSRSDGGGTVLSTGNLGGSTAFTLQPGALAPGEYFAVVNVSNSLGSGVSLRQFRFRVGGSSPGNPPSPVNTVPQGGGNPGNVPPPPAVTTPAVINTTAPAQTGTTPAVSTAVGQGNATPTVNPASTPTVATSSTPSGPATATAGAGVVTATSTSAPGGTPQPTSVGGLTNVGGNGGEGTIPPGSTTLPPGTTSLPRSGGELPLAGFALAAITLVLRRLRLSLFRRNQA